MAKSNGKKNEPHYSNVLTRTDTNFNMTYITYT